MMEDFTARHSTISSNTTTDSWSSSSTSGGTHSMALGATAASRQPPSPHSNARPDQLLHQRTATSMSAGLKQSQATQLSYEATLELYRQNAKKTNDPHTQLEFAKYLIQLAESIPLADDPSDKATRKARDSLLNEGMKWIKRLASNGLGLGKPAYAEAQFFLAECYGNGLFGLHIDHDKAFGLYVQASKQNHPAATYRSAICYELGAGPRKDYARAVQFYRKASALGDTGAMFKLAMILLTGSLNNPKSEREGVTWLKRAASSAAEGDQPQALYELAVIYEKGNVPSIIGDLNYARELYTKAAQMDYAPAQFKLGYCYEYGALTCQVDPRRSIAWYTKAAEQGHPEAELALSGYYLTGSEGVLNQSDSDAFMWAHRSASKAFSKAEYAVGHYHEMGIGTPVNLDQAVIWYTRAASQGNDRAHQRLTDIKNNHKLTVKRGRSGKDGDCVIM
eukprot:Partr_v1_DN28535_c0_g1_i2_m73177